MADTKRYVARFPIKHGVADEMLLLDPGDELNPKDFTDDQIQILVAAGSALPKDVADALLAAEKAQAAAEAAQAEAQTKADMLQSEMTQRDRAIVDANTEQLRSLQPQLPEQPRKQSQTVTGPSKKSG